MVTVYSAPKEMNPGFRYKDAAIEAVNRAYLTDDLKGEELEVFVQSLEVLSVILEHDSAKYDNEFRTALQYLLNVESLANSLELPNKDAQYLAMIDFIESAGDNHALNRVACGSEFKSVYGVLKKVEDYEVLKNLSYELIRWVREVHIIDSSSAEGLYTLRMLTNKYY